MSVGVPLTCGRSLSIKNHVRPLIVSTYQSSLGVDCSSPLSPMADCVRRRSLTFVDIRTRAYVRRSLKFFLARTSLLRSTPSSQIDPCVLHMLGFLVDSSILKIT